MYSFEQLLQETEERYQQRTAPRDEAKKKFEAGKILEADTAERVEKRLNRLQLDRDTAESWLDRGLSFAPIATATEVAGRDDITLERILGASDLMGVSFLELGVLTSRTVARIHIHDSVGRSVGYGTGFMVSPRLLLTNNHVLTDEQEASYSLAEFNYQTGLQGQPLQSVFFALSPSDFFVTDRDLDYTLVAARPRAADGTELAAFGWTRLIEEEGKIIKGEYVNIIQHPNGELKQLALRANQLVDVLDDFLHYETDTAPGSSGSPAYNDQWEVVALHHSGVPKRDRDGNILTRDDRLWLKWMGEHRIAWIANEGVRISRIVRHLKQQSLSPSQRQLRAEMLEALPWAQISRRTPPPGPGPLDYEQAVPGPVLRDDGGATWTVPLRITVHVGEVPKPPPPPQPPAVGAIELPPGAGPEEDPRLRQALKELEEASTRDYYDEEADEAAAEQYYADVDDSVEPKQMFEQLSTLVGTTHTPRPKYDPSLHLYTWVDHHPDGKLRSIYSGKLADPEDYIREDFEISYERARRVQELLAAETALSAEQLEAQIYDLEALRPYNCEHVVPQSWFDRQEPMRGDLHHLFACEWGCNSFRNRWAYYDFVEFEEAYRGDCGKTGEANANQFEPSEGKGPVARATLYFLLRYPGEINARREEFEQERLQTLLDWHEHHPVDEYEKHRNMAIFEKQGNRNPLIDHPEWAEKIDFALGLGD
jgi:endonuclease I/V8-like Glu-specific endopeptidase